MTAAVTGYDAWNDQKLPDKQEMIPRNVKNRFFNFPVLKLLLGTGGRRGLHNSIHCGHSCQHNCHLCPRFIAPEDKYFLSHYALGSCGLASSTDLAV